jgi:hypothetical protein
MQQINAPKPPAWRDPVRLRVEEQRRRLRPVLGRLSLGVGLLLLMPPGAAYDEAISLQLARGEPFAWALFGAMGLTLGYLAVRLWLWQNRIWSLATGLLMLGLVAIALTAPFSSTHQQVFATMCGLMLAGHLGFFLGHLDFRLLPTAVLAVAAVALCFTHLGLGERLLIAATLIALNVLVYGHLDP